MSTGDNDRRRSPRVLLPEQEQVLLQLRTRVRLLDISVSGALVSADVPLPVGALGQLRFAIAGSSYAPTVQIRRRVPAGERDVRVGTVFTGMDEMSRRRLEDFLRKATP